MKTQVIPSVVCGLMLAAGSAVAADLGEFEFRNSCAQCHGDDGTGGGWAAEYLASGPVPDLTMLARNNGGVFPVKRLYEVIDGTADLGVHGRDMPIWGARYTVRAFMAGDDPSADDPFVPMEQHETFVRARILSLIDYLSSIQSE